MRAFTVKDLNGKVVTIDPDVLAMELQESGFTVLGIDQKCIAEFRNQYLKRGGKLDITVETIK
jgi:hypothetical protein